MGNLSAIGFSASSEEELQRVIAAAFERRTPAPNLGASADRHLWFRDASGAALAARLDRRGAVECLTPFFAPPDGGTRWRVRTTAPHLDRECLHCSGADCDVLDPTTGETCTRTTLQFLFFEPYRRWLEEEREFDVVVVAFASSLSLSATPEAFERAQATLFGEAASGVEPRPGAPMRLAPEAFLPHGMFRAEGVVGARARALLTGSAESVSRLSNEVTGGAFLHTRVRTLGGAIDVVAPADATAVPAGARLALADCWLVGRPVEAPPAKGGFLTRLFGGR